MNDGWIKLHRQLLDHPRAKDPDWVAVWVHLMLRATHQPIRMIFGKDQITLRAGQLITSRDSLAEKTGVNSSKVERILKTLKTEQQIEQVSSSVSRLITIVNWPRFQGCEQPNEQQLNSDRTASEQRVNTNKNRRTEEHKKKDGVLEIFQETSEVEIPQNLRTPDFIKTWGEWLPFRKSKGGCKDWMKLFEKQLQWLGSFPEPTAVAILDQSMRNGWQGLFEIKSGFQQARKNSGVPNI